MKRFFVSCTVLLALIALVGCQPKEEGGVISEERAAKLALSYLPIVYDKINTSGHFHYELVNPKVVNVSIVVSEKESTCIVEISGTIMEHPAFPKGLETSLLIHLDPYTGEYLDYDEAL